MFGVFVTEVPIIHYTDTFVKIRSVKFNKILIRCECLAFAHAHALHDHVMSCKCLIHGDLAIRDEPMRQLASLCI